jgi:hypothetical protein
MGAPGDAAVGGEGNLRGAVGIADADDVRGFVAGVVWILLACVCMALRDCRYSPTSVALVQIGSIHGVLGEVPRSLLLLKVKPQSSPTAARSSDPPGGEASPSTAISSMPTASDEMVTLRVAVSHLVRSWPP